MRQPSWYICGPLLERLDLHRQLRQVERAVAGFLVRAQADNAELVLGLVEDLLAVGGKYAGVDAADDQAVLLVLELELADLLLLEIQDAAVDGPQGGIIAALQRERPRCGCRSPRRRCAPASGGSLAAAGFFSS